ncbi:hypothetical protein SDC9_210940 [bioreactor metagenome]|uniref:Uncharacterized protein n=1 Tax=bioreactor metagenome TaxID=1076179 RepID=A0A645JHL9_9ZZZZ
MLGLVGMLSPTFLFKKNQTLLTSFPKAFPESELEINERLHRFALELNDHLHKN